MSSLILLAGGIGSRMKADIPKQHLEVQNHQIIEYTLTAFSASSEIDYIVIVSNEKYMDEMKKICEGFPKVNLIIPGGNTRSLSTFNAIYALKDIISDDEKVIISDAARPCIRLSEIHSLMKSLDKYKAVTTGVEVYETILKTSENKLNDIIQREGVFRQTSPEGYIFKVLKDLYLDQPIELVRNYNNIGIDQMFNKKEEIGIVKSSPLNFKITTSEDISIFESVIKKGFNEFIKS